MKKVIVVLSSALVLFSLNVFAEGDAAAGEKHYQICAACHGANGEGNQALNAPRLTHLQPEYIIAQMNNFRAGIRGAEGSSQASQQMRPMAMALTDEQAIADVAAYIPTMPGGRAAAAVAGDASMGADYFNQFCGACHGAKGQGNTAMTAVAPTLAGASDWYLVAQLKAFRAGERGAHADDKGGRQMRPMSMLLPDDKAVEDVVTFIYGLQE